MLRELKEDVDEVKKMMCEQNRNINKDKKPHEETNRNCRAKRYNN